jgi:hypothetical protein
MWELYAAHVGGNAAPLEVVRIGTIENQCSTKTVSDTPFKTSSVDEGGAGKVRVFPQADTASTG